MRPSKSSNQTQTEKKVDTVVSLFYVPFYERASSVDTVWPCHGLLLNQVDNCLVSRYHALVMLLYVGSPGHHHISGQDNKLFQFNR